MATEHSNPDRERSDTPRLGGPSPEHEDAVPMPMHWYREGQKYNRLILDAIRAIHRGDRTVAGRRAAAADLLLWPLGTLDDPEDLRDFIAGAANAAESYLWDRGAMR